MIARPVMLAEMVYIYSNHTTEQYLTWNGIQMERNSTLSLMTVPFGCSMYRNRALCRCSQLMTLHLSLKVKLVL